MSSTTTTTATTTVDECEDDLLSFEDEASSHGDNEQLEFATRVRSSGLVELDFEHRAASSDERAAYAQKQAEEPGPSEAIATCNRWTNTFTLGPILSREVDMATAQSRLQQPSETPSADRKELPDERRQMLSFEDEASSRDDATLLEIVSRIRTEDFFELKSEHRPASDADRAELDASPSHGAYRKAWRHNMQLGDLLRRNVVARSAAGDDTDVLLSPCSSLDFATILRDLRDEHASLMDDDDGPVRALPEDRHQSRDMAIILLSRCNPQSLIRNTGPRRKGTPASP